MKTLLIFILAFTLSLSSFSQVSLSADADRFEIDNSMIANITVNINNLRGSSFTKLAINSSAQISITPAEKGSAAFEIYEGQKRFIWNTFPKKGSEYLSFRIKVDNYSDPSFSVTLQLSYFEKETQQVAEITSNPIYFEIKPGQIIAAKEAPLVDKKNTKTPERETNPSSTKSKQNQSNLIITDKETPKYTATKNLENHYRVQVVALLNEKSPEKVKSILKLKTLPQKDYHNGFYIYTVGEFENEEEATKNLDLVKTSLPNSFIVQFKNGKRTSP